MTIKVIINGIKGKMGRVTEISIASETDLVLVAGTDHDDDLAKTIKNTGADVVIDFTTPQSIFTNAQTIINNNARPVIGTTGLTLKQINLLDEQCRAKKLGGLVAPNFSLGAMLMMKYAQDAAAYFPDAEIIEMHHQQKLDDPSGTAIKTAQMMAETRPQTDNDTPHKNRARGEKQNGVTIHSVRLPSLFSHQSVIFAGTGETLTIRHDGMDRNCAMPRVFLGCRKVMELDHLVYGLENIL